MKERVCRRRDRFAAGLAALLAVQTLAYAQAPAPRDDVGEPRTPGWTVQPTIGASVSYTDNLFAQVGNEVDDTIWQVVPGIDLGYTGPRAALDLNYQVQGVFFSDQSALDETYHQLASSGSFELARERLFLDAAANHYQQIVDPEERIRFSSIVPNGNFADSLVTSATPRWEQRFGRAAEMDARYTWGRVDYSSPDDAAALDDSQYGGARFTLRRPADAGRLSWGAVYANNRVTYDIRDDMRFDEAYLELGYEVASGLRLLATGGLDTDLEESTNTGGLEEERWEAGFRWQSGPRNLLEAAAGKRFFGDTFRFGWTYVGRILSLAVEYEERPTDLAQEQISRPDSFLASPIVFDNVPLGIELEPFVSKAGSATLGLTGARNALTFTMYAGRRDFINQPDDSRGRRAVLEWTHRLGSTTSLVSSVDWQRIQFRETQDFFEVWQAQAGLERNVGSSITLRALLLHERRTGDDPANEYRTNAVTLGIVKRFNGVGNGGRRPIDAP